MSNVQVTLVQIDNYGPWTVTPTPRREADLQSLQASLYADVAQGFGGHDGYTFFTRFDNMVAVTNGADRLAHERLQESINNRYPVSISLGIGTATTPAAAITDASVALQDAGSAQDGSRTAVLRGAPIPTDQRRDDDLTVAHFDVIDATSKYTDELDAFDSFLQIERGYLSIAEHLRRAHDSLAFFVGGDNMIAVCGDLARPDFEAAIDHVAEDTGLGLQVGVGVGPTAGAAGIDAKHALESCRSNGTNIEVSLPMARSD